MKILNITFDNGEVKIDAKGFTGSDCVKFTAELEKQLGQGGKRVAKPEMYQQAPKQQQAGR